MQATYVLRILPLLSLVDVPIMGVKSVRGLVMKDLLVSRLNQSYSGSRGKEGLCG